MKRHCELVPARTYYGKHATGSVVLVNGHCEFHGKTKDAKAFYKRVNKAVEGLKDLADTLMASASKHFGVPKDAVVVTYKKKPCKKSKEKVITILDTTCPRTKCPRYDDGCDLPPELCPFNNNEK